MKRILTGVVLLVGCWVVSPRLALAVITTDTVEYIDPKTKEKVTVAGQISEETPAGLKFKDANSTRSIPALAITEIMYRCSSNRIDYREGFSAETRALSSKKPAERNSLLAKSLEEYQKLDATVKDSKNVHRYIQFKIAEVKVHQSREEPANKALGKAAVDALTIYKEQFPGGWEIVPCLKLLARLHEEQGEPAKAREAYEAILRIPDAPLEVRQQSDLMVAQMMVRGKDYKEAEQKLKTLADSLSPEDPRKALVQVYLVETQIAQNKLENVEPALKSALQASSDPRLKATAHNFLGDYYRLKKQDEEALWQYLMVDALYTQDRDEHAKALSYIAKLFESTQGNKARAQQYLDKLKALSEKSSTTPEK